MKTMLEHQKLILVKLSHDREMFRKEIIKSFRWLKSCEIIRLRRWLKDNYGIKYSDIIREVFEYIPA